MSALINPNYDFAMQDVLRDNTAFDDPIRLILGMLDGVNPSDPPWGQIVNLIWSGITKWFSW
jgi:hypothetical protein